MPSRLGGPHGCSEVCAVQRPLGGVRRLRLHGENMGPRTRGMFASVVRTYQQGVLVTGLLTMNLKDAHD